MTGQILRPEMNPGLWRWHLQEAITWCSWPFPRTTVCSCSSWFCCVYSATIVHEKRLLESYPLGNNTTTFAPTVSAIACPSFVFFNQLKAPLKALPLLPPTSSPSVLIKEWTAPQASSSEVLIQVSISAGSCDRMSGTKLCLMPSTTEVAPSSAILRELGKVRMLPFCDTDKWASLEVDWDYSLQGQRQWPHISDCGPLSDHEFLLHCRPSWLLLKHQWLCLQCQHLQQVHQPFWMKVSMK